MEGQNTFDFLDTFLKPIVTKEKWFKRGVKETQNLQVQEKRTQQPILCNFFIESVNYGYLKHEKLKQKRQDEVDKKIKQNLRPETYPLDKLPHHSKNGSIQVSIDIQTSLPDQHSPSLQQHISSSSDDERESVNLESQETQRSLFKSPLTTDDQIISAGHTSSIHHDINKVKLGSDRKSQSDTDSLPVPSNMSFQPTNDSLEERKGSVQSRYLQYLDSKPSILSEGASEKHTSVVTQFDQGSKSVPANDSKNVLSVSSMNALVSTEPTTDDLKQPSLLLCTTAVSKSSNTELDKDVLKHTESVDLEEDLKPQSESLDKQGSPTNSFQSVESYSASPDSLSIQNPITENIVKTLERVNHNVKENPTKSLPDVKYSMPEASDASLAENKSLHNQYVSIGREKSAREIKSSDWNLRYMSEHITMENLRTVNNFTDGAMAVHIDDGDFFKLRDQLENALQIESVAMGEVGVQGASCFAYLHHRSTKETMVKLFMNHVIEMLCVKMKLRVHHEYPLNDKTSFHISPKCDYVLEFDGKIIASVELKSPQAINKHSIVPLMVQLLKIQYHQQNHTAKYLGILTDGYKYILLFLQGNVFTFERDLHHSKHIVKIYKACKWSDLKDITHVLCEATDQCLHPKETAPHQSDESDGLQDETEENLQDRHQLPRSVNKDGWEIPEKRRKLTRYANAQQYYMKDSKKQDQIADRKQVIRQLDQEFMSANLQTRGNQQVSNSESEPIVIDD